MSILKHPRVKWFGTSLLPLLILLGIGSWYSYQVLNSPLEFRSLEGFSLENELLIVTYTTLILAAASWWSMLSLYGKRAFTREHIWPSLFTVGAFLTLAATVVFVMSILGSDDDLWVKILGFVLASLSTLLLTLRDHKQLTQ